MIEQIEVLPLHPEQEIIKVSLSFIMREFTDISCLEMISAEIIDILTIVDKM